MGLLNFYNPGQDRLNPQFRAILEKVAPNYGGFGITSGYRSPTHNASVGGVKGSFHTKGEASDIDLSNMDEAQRAKVVQDLIASGARGFGLYANSPNMLHVDTRGGGPVHFMYDKSSRNMANAPAWFRGLAGQPAGPNQGLADDAMVAIGKQPLHNHGNTPYAPAGAPQATGDMTAMRGLLEMLRGGGAPAQAGQGGIFSDQGFLNEDRRHRLAAGLEGMTLNPNAARIEALYSGIDNRKKAKTEAAANNRTAAWLEATGRPDLAALVLAGSVSGKEAVGIAMTPPTDTSTALQKNYDFLRSKGASHEEALAQLKSGSTTEINLPGDGLPTKDLDKELMKKTGEQWSAYLDQGAAAVGMMNDMTILQELATQAPTGPLSGRLAEAFPEFSDAATAFQSIVARLAPTLRVPGSGATSDLEFQKMIDSLPKLRNNPTASIAIAEMFKAKAELNMERARIVQQYQSDGNVQAAREALAALDRRSIMSPALRQVIETLSNSSGQTGGAPLWERDGIKIERLN